MRTLVSFFILLSIKVITRIFYRVEVNWISPLKEDWSQIRLISFMNHTSLYEPLYIVALPVSFLWRLARKMVIPGASKTMNRPLVGLFWKLFSPGMKTISRQRDKTWRDFMDAINNRSVIIIAPEGRMKRATGLDVKGNKMTVRSGIADILDVLEEGRILFAYSGGLHHIQEPGQRFPKLFKKIHMNLELIEIAEYKKIFQSEGVQWKKDVVEDIRSRLENNCPEQPE